MFHSRLSCVDNKRDIFYIKAHDQKGRVTDELNFALFTQRNTNEFICLNADNS